MIQILGDGMSSRLQVSSYFPSCHALNLKSCATKVLTEMTCELGILPRSLCRTKNPILSNCELVSLLLKINMLKVATGTQKSLFFWDVQLPVWSSLGGPGPWFKMLQRFMIWLYITCELCSTPNMSFHEQHLG